ncbi:hypothetical protein [Streptomyces sp. ST2-7A]|uniref:hypothetical protein n=1 Tax=Streptomyces sp. ST2-7A TaxID=2907214 RepID=UPI001F3ADE01|nr:hypothetical protein [Streptomyces sp. ST2-7A]MCE7078651.1 hypothetical protein [Streptomyces sp. ST2-7A]
MRWRRAWIPATATPTALAAMLWILCSPRVHARLLALAEGVREHPFPLVSTAGPGVVENWVRAWLTRPPRSGPEVGSSSGGGPWREEVPAPLVHDVWQPAAQWLQVGVLLALCAVGVLWTVRRFPPGRASHRVLIPLCVWAWTTASAAVAIPAGHLLRALPRGHFSRRELIGSAMTEGLPLIALLAVPTALVALAAAGFARSLPRLTPPRPEPALPAPPTPEAALTAGLAGGVVTGALLLFTLAPLWERLLLDTPLHRLPAAITRWLLPVAGSAEASEGVRLYGSGVRAVVPATIVVVAGLVVAARLSRGRSPLDLGVLGVVTAVCATTLAFPILWITRPPRDLALSLDHAYHHLPGMLTAGFLSGLVTALVLRRVERGGGAGGVGSAGNRASVGGS